MEQKENRVSLPLLLVVLIWGVNYTSIKLGLRELPPLTWAAARFSFATVCLFALLWVRERSFFIDRRDWLQTALVGVLGVGANNLLFTVGLRYTTSANASLILASSPIITGLLAWLIGQERFHAGKMAGVLLSFGGVAVLFLGPGAGHGGADSTLRGDLLTAAGSAFAGAFPVFLAPLVRRYSALKATAWTCAGGAAFMLLFAPMEFSQIDFSRLTLVGPLTIAYSALLSTVVAQVVWNNAVGKTGATRVAAHLYLPPLIAAAVSAAVLGEAVRPNQILGALVIFAGLYFVNRPQPPQKAPAVAETELP